MINGEFESQPVSKLLIPKEYAPMHAVMTDFVRQPNIFSTLTRPIISLGDVTTVIRQFSQGNFLNRWNEARASAHLSPCRLNPDSTPRQATSLLLANLRQGIPHGYRSVISALRDGMPSNEFFTLLTSIAPGFALVPPEMSENMTPEQIATLVVVPVILGLCGSLGGSASNLAERRANIKASKWAKEEVKKYK